MKTKEKIQNAIKNLELRQETIKRSLQDVNNLIATYTNILGWLEEDEKVPVDDNEEIEEEFGELIPLKQPIKKRGCPETPQNWNDLVKMNRHELIYFINYGDIDIDDDLFTDEDLGISDDEVYSLRIKIADILNIPYPKPFPKQK